SQSVRIIRLRDSHGIAEIVDAFRVVQKDHRDFRKFGELADRLRTQLSVDNRRARIHADIFSDFAEPVFFSETARALLYCFSRFGFCRRHSLRFLPFVLRDCWTIRAQPHGDTEWLSRRQSLVQSRVEFAITLETGLHHFCTPVIEVDFLSSFVEYTFPRFAVGAMSSLHQFVGRSLAGRSAPDAI